MTEIRMLRIPVVCDRFGVPRSTFYRDVKLGLCTTPVKIGEKSSALPQHEVDAINAARLAGKTRDEIRALVKDLIAARTEPRAA